MCQLGLKGLREIKKTHRLRIEDEWCGIITTADAAISFYSAAKLPPAKIFFAISPITLALWKHKEHRNYETCLTSKSFSLRHIHDCAEPQHGINEDIVNDDVVFYGPTTFIHLTFRHVGLWQCLSARAESLERIKLTFNWNQWHIDVNMDSISPFVEVCWFAEGFSVHLSSFLQNHRPHVSPHDRLYLLAAHPLQQISRRLLHLKCTLILEIGE